MVAGLQPAAAGQRDDVKGDGAEQEQGQDPPAALAGQAAAQHLDGGARRRGARGARERRRVARERRPRDKRDEAAPGPTQTPVTQSAAPTCPRAGRTGEARRAQVTPARLRFPVRSGRTWSGPAWGTQATALLQPGAPLGFPATFFSSYRILSLQMGFF